MSTQADRSPLPDGLHVGFADFARACDTTEIEQKMLVSAAAEAIEDRYGIAFRAMEVTWFAPAGQHILPYRPFDRSRSAALTVENEHCALIDGRHCDDCAVEVQYITGHLKMTDAYKLAIWRVASAMSDEDPVNWASIDDAFRGVMISQAERFYTSQALADTSMMRARY